MFKLLVLGLCWAFASGQIPSLGFCPDYVPMNDFDLERFLGKWYEAERYFTFSEVATRCVVTDYARGASGRIFVSNEVTNRLTGVKRVIAGNLELAGKAGEGKLHVRYATTPLPSESTLTILDTDYDNYAIIWSCSGFGPVHAQNAWVMTRERLPDGPTMQQAYGILDKFKISRTFFVKTDQEGCAVAASDLNAANGITSQSTVAEATGSVQKKLGGFQGENVATAAEAISQNSLSDQGKEKEQDKLTEQEAKPASEEKTGNEPAELPQQNQVEDKEKDQSGQENLNVKRLDKKEETKQEIPQNNPLQVEQSQQIQPEKGELQETQQQEAQHQEIQQQERQPQEEKPKDCKPEEKSQPVQSQVLHQEAQTQDDEQQKTLLNQPQENQRDQFEENQNVEQPQQLQQNKPQIKPENSQQILQDKPSTQEDNQSPLENKNEAGKIQSAIGQKEQEKPLPIGKMILKKSDQIKKATKAS